MSYGGGGAQPQIVMPTFTKVVKNLVIINVSCWIGLVLIAQGLMDGQPIYQWFGLIPDMVINNFTIWQFFSYMFLHSSSVFHVLFNMLILWMFGSELEMRWGGKFFLTYYLVCGVGAAVLYTICILAYYFISGNYVPLMAPVVGASGAVFGLLLAYGIIFGERVIYFMMIFPMKAKYFAMILGAVELLTLMSSGFSGQVANLAHLGGIVSGFLFLTFWTRWKTKSVRKSTQKRGRKLKLVVNNDKPGSDGDGPKYWN